MALKDLLIKVKLDDKEFRKGTRRMKSNVAGLGKTLGFAAIGVGIARGLQDAFQKMKKFEQANANLASILGKSNDQIKRLSSSAKKLGAVSAFSASEITGLQTELAKLGFVENDILKVTKSVGDFSIAVGTDAASAAETAGGALRAFGLEASEMGSLVSTMAIATTKSALDFEKLKTSIGIVAPVANSAGVSFQRTIALLGTLSNRGIDASTAGTGLRNIFLELSKSGLTWDQAMGRINSASDKNAAALQLFGKRGATVGTVLADTMKESDLLTASITNQDAAMKIMVEQRMDTMEGKLILLKSAWEGFVLEVDSGDGVISTALKGAAGFVTDLLDDLRVLNKFGTKGLLNKGRGVRNIDPSDFSRGRGTGSGKDTFGEQLRNTRSLVKNLTAGLKGLDRESDDFKQQQEDIAIATKKLNVLLKEQAVILDKKGGTGKKDGEASSGIKLLKEQLADLEEQLENFGGSKSELEILLEKAILKSAELRGELELLKIAKAEFAGRFVDQISKLPTRNAISAPTSGSIDLQGSGGITTQISGGTDPLAELPGKHKQVKEDLRGEYLEMIEDANKAKEGMTMVTADFGAAIGSVFDNINTQGLGNSLLLALANLGESVGKQLLTISVALEALSKLPIGGKIAAAIALIAFSKVIRGRVESSAAKLAEGGLIYGPTSAIVGDNPGARHDPEVVSPLSKLKRMLGDGGGGSWVLNTRLLGSDLELLLERQLKKTSGIR